MQKSAFTLIELIFVIVLIGVLAAVAIPKFSGLSANSKVAAELATASTIQSAIDDVHSEWVISEGHFSWGNNRDENNVTDTGYPTQLSSDCSSSAFNWILKSSSTVDPKWSCTDNGDGTFKYEGPASDDQSGVKDKAGKPSASKHWKYDSAKGTFTLEDD